MTRYTFIRLSLVLFVFACNTSQAQKAFNFGKLKLANEKVLFGFELQKSKKIVVVCQDTNARYLVYRFGTPELVDLSYPENPDTGSWRNFKYYGYYRGGGIQNAAMGEYTLTFTNKDVTYELYENWSSENNSLLYMGINVSANGKKTDLKGNNNRKWGSLDELRFMSDLIPNQWP